MIRPVTFPQDQLPLTTLIREYVDWLGIDLSYQNFEQEMASLDKLFTMPHGAYYFAEVDGMVAGGVGFRSIDAQTAEVKRLYVRKQFLGNKLGAALMENLLKDLKILGYDRAVLDAVPPTLQAQKLYKSLGFYEIEPYFDNPVKGTRFYSIDL